MTTTVTTVDVQVRNPDGQIVDHLPVDAKNAGQITSDRTATVRRTISTPIRIVDPTGRLMPRYATDTLHPYSSNELWVFRSDDNGTMRALGVFGLTKPVEHLGNDGWYLALNGSDRAHRVQRTAWTDLYSITGTPNLNVAGQDLILDRMAAAGIPTTGPGSWQFNLAPTDAVVQDTTFGIANGALTSGLSTFYGTDPWADVTGLFTDAAEELFFDAQGVVVAQPVPDPASSAPVATYVDGVDGTTVSIDRSVDLDSSYSGVMVIGTGSTVPSPLLAVVWDPTSVGLMGHVPYVYQTSNITSQAQAEQVANTLLPTVIGAQESVTVTARCDPARAASDVVRVVSDRGGLDSNFLLQQVMQPLTINGLMSMTSSRQVPA